MSASKQPAPLAIGALFSQSGAGDAVGPDQLQAAQLAVDQINAAGGVDGAPLRLIELDDRSDPAHGAEEMRTLIEDDRVVAVLGPTLSRVALQAHPVADSLETPVLSVSNTADGIVSLCPHRCDWIWRNSLGGSVAVPANITQFVSAKHPSTALIAHSAGDPAGESEAESATQTFDSEHVRVLADMSMTAAGSTQDVVAKLFEVKPDVLFIATSTATTAIALTQQARAAGFAGAILGGDVLNAAAVATLAGAAGAEAQSGAAWYPGNAFPANATFIRDYQRATGAQPDQFAAWAYAGVVILANALHNGRLAGSTASLPQQRSAVQKALGNTALMTPMGPFRFTADHDVDQIVWVQQIDGHGGHDLVGFCNGKTAVVSTSASGC